MTVTKDRGPLDGLRVLDLSRVLAGPTCTQLLGDLGADVIKIERPGAGDDTRGWGPPYLKDGHGKDTGESAYYLSSNRNKRSVTVDISQPAGQALVLGLLDHCDIMIENFKVGGLAKYGLAYDQLSDRHPALIYCSISGFGQTGPKASLPGYDYMIQAMGGIMSITGEADGEPMKVGVAAADVMCGMYAAVAILAALNFKNTTGKGQYIDLGLFDTQVAWLINAGLNHLVSGELPKRYGNAHPNVVPYQLFLTSDGHVVLAVGNDGQLTDRRIRPRKVVVDNLHRILKVTLHGPTNVSDPTHMHPGLKNSKLVCRGSRYYQCGSIGDYVRFEERHGNIFTVHGRYLWHQEVAGRRLPNLPE